ncbi:MAG TPA: hypothetical protein VF411_03000 [Bacteroidia bacterium]
MRLLLFYILLLAANFIYGARNYKGYYITLKNDTINTTIIYTDIIDLQHKLVVKELDGTQKTFQPNDIKGFTIQLPDSFSFSFANFDRETDKREARQIRLYSPSLFWGGRVSRYFDEPQDLYFESVSLEFSTVFLHVKAGNNENLKYLKYYYVEYKTGRTIVGWIVGTVSFLIKDNRFLQRERERRLERINKFLAQIVSDDTLLVKMIKEKRVSDISVIVNEYNHWKNLSPENKADTSLTKRGIFDAEKYYKHKKFFWITTGTGAVVMIPGLITGIAIDYSELPIEKLNIPANSKYFLYDTYIAGYKMRAKELRQKSLQRGLLAGCALFLALAFLSNIK